MKKHNIFKVVLITMLVFLVLSWIFPAAYYSGEFVDQGRVQMGLFDLFDYPLLALSYFGYIVLYLVLVGGFYGVLYKIPAYRLLLDKIVAKVAGKEKVALAVMVVVISLLVSVCGFHIGVALFVPFLVALIYLMGYDKIVAAMVLVGSVSVGLAGSTYAYGNLSILLEGLSLKNDYQILVRFLILLVGVVILLFNVYMYIKESLKVSKAEKKTVKKVEVTLATDKVEKKITKTTVKKTTAKGKSTGKKSNNKSKSRKNPNKAALREAEIIVVKENVDENSAYVPEKVVSNQKTWPMTLVLVLLFVLVCLAFVTWNENGFGIKLFEDITKAVKEFEIGKFPIFAKILGSRYDVKAFGLWSITDLFLPMGLIVLVLSIVYKLSFDDVVDGFVKGAKKALYPAVIVVFIYSILVLVTYHTFQLVLYKAILGWTKGFNIFTTVLVSLLAGLFNSDIYYTFQSVVPYFASVVELKDYSVAGLIFQSMYGVTSLVAPTSLVLMTALAYLGVSYKEWLKNVWKFLLELFVVLLVIIVILYAL